ncbi:MAG: hypothetical protein PHC55_13025 [Bacteroidales bacterium]|nr:hypothetical protein [Bacteroidales bacterium]
MSNPLSGHLGVFPKTLIPQGFLAFFILITQQSSIEAIIGCGDDPTKILWKRLICG